MSRETSSFARKFSILLLSLLMCLNQLPLSVFAQDETGTETADTEAVNSSDDESAAEGFDLIEVSEEDTAETALGMDDNDDLFSEYVDHAFNGLYDAEIQHIGNIASTQSNEDKLGGLELTIYQFLAEKVLEVSSGSLTSTVFSISLDELGLTGPYTAADLGVEAIVADGAITADAKEAYTKKLDFDSGLVLDALRSDYPYDLFWYDKTAQTSTKVSKQYSASGNTETGYELSVSGSITISMPVAVDYSASGTAGTYELSNVVEKVQTAADNAQTIVQNNAGLEDYDKVTAYKNAICDWTSYNDDAADESKKTPYGDPWQLIWVFDGDETTSVVCEGYAKAFKYLCDLSRFSSSRIDCYLVSGTMAGGSGEGRHMWNIIRMDDNKNYLVDVTNCDTGTIGNPDDLFLKGYTSSEQINAEETDSDENSISYPTTKYTFNIKDSSISYYYGNDTETLYDDSELSISDSDYDPSVIIADDGHYMAFATDRHGNTSAIGEAMSAMNEYPVEYVSMIGDMVGSGGSDAPAYDTTVVLDEVKAVFPWLSNKNVSIVYGSHDAGAVDNADILKCKPTGSSTHIYTGYNDNGEVSYYVYGIAYDDMLNASYAKTSAENFRHWVDYEAYDKSVPIIVLCHVPIHAKRGDNKGASYWNAALNYAATGSDNGTEVRRNVVFLHGHNHTSEQVEYYYEPGATISVQKDTGSSSGSRPGGSSSASGESSVIYYTYITAGYLKQMSTKNATLIHLDDDALTFTKYNSGTPSVLGTAAHIHKENLPGPETLSFNGDNLAIDKNQTESIWSYLTQTEDELNGSNLTVTSSNLSVISCEGESITALKGGTAVITVRTDNGKEASAEFTVKAYAESIDFAGESAVTIRRGESAKLECVLSPTDEILCEKAVWSVTGQDGVVELDQDGNITGIYIGETAVTASVSSGSITYTVKVVTAITSVAFGEDSYEMAYGTTNDVAGEVSWLPAEEDPGVLTYETDNPDVVTVEGSILQAVNGGVANITVKADNGLEDTAEFTVIRFADGISPVGDTSLNLKPGDTYTPECDLYTEDGSDVYGDSVTWTIQSMTDDCISVDESTGKITALNAGDAEVTGYTANGASVTYFVHVIQELTEFAFGESYYEIDYGYEFNVMDYLTYAPENAEFEIVSVTSTNSDVLKIDGFNLTASAKGTATVIVTADTGKTAEADFRVIRYAEGIRKENADTIYLQPEEGEQLKYVLLPEGAEFDDEIIWTRSSPDDDYITLTDSGYVTGKNYGSANVQARTHEDYYVDYYIVVYKAPEDLQFYNETTYIRPGTNAFIWNYIWTNTDYASYAPVTVTSSRPDVIEIDGMNLKAVGNGPATITVNYEDKIIRTAEFVVGEYAEGISRVTVEDIYIRPGSEKTLEYTLYPEGESMNSETVTWKLSDDCGGIFELTDGVLKANDTDVLFASAAVEASIANGNTIVYDVHLYTDPENFAFENEENYLRINSGRSVWEYLDITPEEVSSFPVTVESGDPEKVAVSYDYLSGNSKGSSLITVTDEYGNSKSANFTVGYYADQINHDGDQSAELEIGDTFTPKYYYFAYDEGDCSDEKVTWSIESMTNDCISLNSETGEVTAVNGGEAVIKATIKNGTYIEYGIRIRTPLENVRFTEESYEINYENTYSITDFITYEPADADISSIIFTSDHPDIIDIVDNTVIAKDRGTAVITASLDNMTVSAVFTVHRYADGIRIAGDGSVYVRVGGHTNLGYTLEPEDEELDDEIVWEIGEIYSGSFTLDDQGNVTGESAGQGYVTATTHNGYRIQYNIYVYELPDGISFGADSYNMKLEDSMDIWNYLIPDPYEAYGCAVTVTSSDESVISIDGKTLNGVGKGQTTITVTTENGLSDSAEFTVANYADSIEKANNSTIYLKPTEVQTLDYVLYPDDQANEDEVITWDLHDPENSPVTLEQNGTVTAKPDVYGYTYVTATITNGSSVTYDIYVYDDPEAVNTHHTEYYLRPDEWHTVWEYIYLSPDDSLRCPVTVTCEPEDIISIDGEALTSQVCGTAKISVSAENGESTEFTLNVGYYANEIWAADSQSIILNAGESYTPVCQLYAYDEGPCSDEKVTWSVLNDDNNCISIDGETGRITALRQGSATVRAAIKNGQYIEYDVTVSPEIESIQFRSERFVFEYWWEQDIWQYLTYSPYDANRSSITITSDRPDILSVTDQMLVPISTGTANITVETVGGLSTTAEFTVKKTAQNIERIGDFNRKLAIGDECQLQYKLLPENEDLEETVTWRLGYNNNNCIELSETGYVKAIQPGDASISAVLWNGLEASYHIEVYEAPTKIAFREHPSYTRVGAYINLMTLLDIEPAGAADAPLTISSSDESVIKIDGVVIQVLKDGRAEVTVTADNGVSDTVEFITGNYAESIDYPDTYFNVCVGSERQLKYLLSPDPSEADLSDEEVTWSIVEGSENITIDNNGLVKGVKTGTAVVRASIRSGQYLEYHLTVIEAPHSVSFSRERIGFASDSQFWIQEYLNTDPYEARYATGMTVSFSNPGILSEPNGDGYLVAVGRGRTNVTVTLDNGLTASAEFVVGNIADGINGSGISGAMIVGDSASIGYSLYADGHGTEDEVVTWSVVGGEPSDCVTIAQDGTVTANKAGYAYVRAQILNGEYTEFYVRVVEKPDRLAFSANDLYFSLNRYDGDEGYYYNIKDYLTGYPLELPVTGSSSDKNVIEFDSNNINFETKSKGSALVTAEGINGLKATAVFHTGWYALGISTDYLAYVEKGGQRQIIPSFGDPGLINASDEVITWSSDDESIATVDANGVVTGVSPGKTIIKAKILNGSEAWTYTYVYEKPTSVRFKNPKLYMNLNYDQFTPITEYLDIEPEGAKYADYTITTDNVDVISVSDRDIYGVQNGTANVTVTIDGLSTSAQFTTGYYATYICPKNSSFERINVDDTVQLETYMEASGGDFSDDRITWKVSSSDPQGCISVDTTGLVTANSIGTGTVTAETLCGYSAVFTIDVVEDIQTIRFNRDRLYLAVDSNRSVWDYLDVEPYSSAYTRVEVTSSEGNIVEIKDGMWLHAAAPGDAVITVRTKNNVAASVPVTVGYYASDIDSDETDVAILFGQEKQLKFDLISDSGQPITDEELEWTIINDPDHCISMSDDGRIKAINYGSAVVQVFTRNRSWVRYCIDVIHNPERISFDKAEYYLPKDSSETLYLTSQPDQSSFIRYIFTSSDETVAEIEYDGHLHSSVKYVSDGTATIRAVSPYDGTVYAECKVTAYTPESATDIDVQDHLTGYAGYILNVPFKLVPVTAEKDITVTFSNNNISLEKIIGDRAWLKCESTGTTNVTFTAASGISKSVEVNVIDGVPEFDASLTVFEYGDNYLAPVKGTSQVNLDQYTFIVGKTYGFSVLYDIAGKTASVPSYNDMFNSLQKYTVQTDLFDQIGQGYGYAADSYSVQIPAKAVRAGTLEAEFIPGRKVLLKVADYAQAQNTVNVSETIEPETASSITEAIESNDDAFGISDELRNAAAEVTIPEDIQVSEGEKIIVETHLDINVTDLKKEEDGTASLAVNIEPKYQIKTVNENTGAETEVTSPSILEVNEPVTITIPVGDAFKDRDVKTVLVKHTKEDGTVYTYKGIYQDGTVTFVNPDGFSDFEIIVLDDSYDNDPVYTWEETEDGWKVTGTITSTLGKVIKEETEAVRTVYYDATCTQGSVEIYEAVFRNQMFARQMKEIRTEALGHSYVLSRWQWNDDLTEAYAVFRCTVCDHEESVKADVSVNEYGSTATVLFMDKEYIDTCNAGPSPVLEITVTPDTLKLGIKETSQLTAMVIGANEGTEVIWKSLSPDIASVDSNGLVTAKMPGTAVIHAMIAEKEDIYAECTVIVEDDYILRNIAFRHSCSFGNDLSINYYTPMADLEGYENIRMEVRKQIFEKDGTISWETTELANYTQSNPDGDDYYRFAYTGIAAKEMGSEVRMVLLCEKDGHTYTTEDDVYGIGTYAYNRLEASTDNTFKTLIVDMLNYGAKAQEYFNYNKTNLVNAALTEEQKALGTQTDPELKSVEKVTETAGATATFYGKSAVFNSNVELKYYMQFAETQNLKNVKLVLTYIAIDGTAYKEEIKAGDFGYDTSKKAYTAKLISIAAKDVGCTVTAKIYDGSKLISNTLEYSLETYAYNRLIKSTDEVFKAFIKAFMKYGFSAEAYFRSKNPNN